MIQTFNQNGLLSREQKIRGRSIFMILYLATERPLILCIFYVAREDYGNYVWANPREQQVWSFRDCFPWDLVTTK